MEGIINNKYFTNTMSLQNIAINNCLKTVKMLETSSYSRMINNINTLSNSLKSPILECVVMQNRLSDLFKIPSITIPRVESNIYKLINIDQRLFKQNIDAITRWTDLTNTWTNTYERINNLNRYIQYPKYENIFYQSFARTLNDLQFKREIDTEDIDIENIDKNDIKESVEEFIVLSNEFEITDEPNRQQRIITFINKWIEKNPLIFKVIMLLITAICLVSIDVIGTLISNSIVHEEPSRKSQVILKLDKEQQVRIIGEAPYYFQIEMNDGEKVTGWISKRSVTLKDKD